LAAVQRWPTGIWIDETAARIKESGMKFGMLRMKAQRFPIQIGDGHIR
jgi:hypothetical protein